MTDDFGLQVRRARERLMMDRRQFADLVQVSEKTVQNWELGKSTPRNRMGVLEMYLNPPSKQEALPTALGSEKDAEVLRQLSLYSIARQVSHEELGPGSWRGDSDPRLTAIADAGDRVRAAAADPDCTCSPGTEATGWAEQRCRYCIERDRQQWARVSEVGEEIRRVGLDAWVAQREAEGRRDLYDYLGMDRAR